MTLAILSHADNLAALADATIKRLIAAKLMVATAESCTGGLIAGALTAVAGSSATVERGFVTYSNEAKMELLGVPGADLEAHGAVSEPVARAMVIGALRNARADIAVGVTGIAGPAHGGSPTDKPVGLVFIACGRKGAEPRVERHIFPGDRTEVRCLTVKRALELLLEAAA